MATSASPSSSSSSISILDEFPDFLKNEDPSSKEKIERERPNIFIDESIESMKVKKIGLELFYRGWSGEDLAKKGANRFYQNGGFIYVFTSENYEEIKKEVIYWKREKDYILKLQDMIERENSESPLNLKKCYEELEICYKEPDDEKLAISLQKLADGGNVLAQYRFGELLLKYKTIEDQCETAFKWYKKAAHKGYVVALTILGGCYENAIGTKKDPNQAFKCYNEAAKKGYFIAKRHLQRCYQNGIGTKSDAKLAFDWCTEAAKENEHPGQLEAIRNLANFYFDGIGVEQNRIKAIELYKQAASLGDEEAKINLRDISEYEKTSSRKTGQLPSSIKRWLVTAKPLRQLREFGEILDPRQYIRLILLIYFWEG